MGVKISGMTAAVLGDLGLATSEVEVSIDVTTTPLTRRLTLAVLSAFLAANLGFNDGAGNDLSFTHDIVINSTVTQFGFAGVHAGFGPGGDFESTCFGWRALQNCTLAPAGNTAFGSNALANQGNGGESNAAFGHQAGSNQSAALFTCLIGSAAGQGGGSGSPSYDHTVAVGSPALQNAFAASYVTAVGYDAMGAPQHGTDGYVNTTAVGALAFVALPAPATGGVALGAYAGAYETASHAFYVNDKDQGDTATEKANSLLYGTFGANAAAQMLTVNAGTIKFTGKGGGDGTITVGAADSGGAGFRLLRVAN